MRQIVKNRRVMMRVAFVAACLVPTLAMLVISTVALARRSAAEATEQWKMVIEFQLGLSVDIERTEPATRGVTLHDVAIRHPESGALIARIRQVYIAQAGERGWIIECRYPELDADRFPHLWNMLKDRLTNRRGTADWSGTLTATNIAWRDGAQTATIPHVQCDMRHSIETSECSVEYYMEEQDPRTPSKLVVRRSRDLHRSGVTYDWETTSGPFPLRWLSQANPNLKRLGDKATFDGRVEVRSGPTGATSGNLEGSIHDIDLAELVSRPFPHHILRGGAELNFSSLTWEADRITNFHGELASDNGRISRSLLDAANHVGLEIPGRLRNHPLFGYRRLRLRFDGRGEQLDLNGDLDNGNVVLLGADDNQTPLLAATSAKADTGGLLRWMVPDSRHYVPATPQIGYLANLFQLPDVDPGERKSLPTPALNLGVPPDDE